MSLLPRALLVNDPLSPLGKLVVREEPKVDPNAWFDEEGRKHPDDKPASLGAAQDSRKTVEVGATRPSPVAAPPTPEFKPGDRFMVVGDTTGWYQGNEATFVRYESPPSRAWSFLVCSCFHKNYRKVIDEVRFPPEWLELISPSKPTEDSEGWMLWGGAGQVPPAKFVKLRNGDVLAADQICTWAHSDKVVRADFQVVAYK